MKKILLILGIGTLFGCSNQEALKIKEDTPIPIKAKKGDSYIFLDDLEYKSTPSYIICDEEKQEVKILFKTRKNDVDKINLVLNGEKYPMVSVGVVEDEEVFSVELPYIEQEELKYHFELKDDKFKYYFGENSGYEIAEVTNFDYIVTNNKRKLPEWSEGMVWYSIYVDSFRDGTDDNSPIFSELGPGYYFGPSGSTNDGTPKIELINSNRWETKGRLQEFEITPWGSDWNTAPYSEVEASNKYYQYAIKNTRRFGGDLQGVMEKLDYLKELGVDGINLSPVFYSYSGNKLDTINYSHISPDYAITTKKSYLELENNIAIATWTESDIFFQKLVNEIHKRDMKIVLDINLSYVSPEFFAYKDVLKNKEKSKYFNWFIFNQSNEEKSDLQGIEKTKKIMLNLENVELQNYLIESTTKWVKGYKNSGIDGYFVKNSIENKDFLQKWKEKLLEINSEFILVGEDTELNKTNVSIDGFDIIGSYQLGKFLKKILGGEPHKVEEMKSSLDVYSINPLRWNFIDSYDTDRFYSSIINKRSGYDERDNYGVDDYINIRPDLIDKSAKEKIKLATLMSLTVEGSPVIYYGDEKGMWGADAPDSRKPQLWDDIVYEPETDSLEKYDQNKNMITKKFKLEEFKQDLSYVVKSDEELEEWYKKTLKLRKMDEELFQKGNLKVLNLDYKKYLENGEIITVHEPDVLVFEREYEGRSAIIIINTSDGGKSVKIPVNGGQGYTDLYSEKEYNFLGKVVKVKLKGYGYAVLYRKSK